METSIFVVSDLHLGGGNGFQMCEASGRKRLAELFAWISEQSGAKRRAWIVIAGDIVDFLAEEPYAAFTANESEATQKLERILLSTDEVWTALAKAAERCTIAMLLGNHDVELAMAQPRRRLLQRLGRPIEFLFDNEAFVFGDLLVEHGNRYDPWNVVDHDALRQLRSRASRGEPSDEFPTQPGSELVARVMNGIKQRHPWVDLLKPESSAVVPILAALGESSWQIAADAAKAAAGATWRSTQFDRNGVPTASRFVLAGASPVPRAAASRLPVEEVADVFKLLEEAGDLSAPQRPEERMVVGGVTGLNEKLLFRGLRYWREKDNKTFRVDAEDERYLGAARRLAEVGKRKVVVFGHTHHAKRVELGGSSNARYLNTGTWADLIRVPEEIFSDDDSSARAAFAKFMDALKIGAAALRRHVPTFARVDFDAAGNLRASDVHLFDESSNTSPITTDEILKRLEVT